MTVTNSPADLVRNYLATLLPTARAEELTPRALDAAGHDADAIAVLAAAHRLLTSELRVSERVAADVLVEEVGVSPREAAQVLDMDEDEVVGAVAEARAIADELGAEGATASVPPSSGREEPSAAEETVADGSAAAPAPEPVTYVFDAEGGEPYEPAGEPLFEPTGSGRARRLTVIVGTLILLALVLALVTRGGGGQAPPQAAPTSQVTVTAAGTALPAEDGGPGIDQQEFAPEDAVVFWFEYEPVDGDARVELVLSRNGQELIDPEFPLPARRTDSHVTLPRAMTEEPGDYTIRLLRDGRELTEVSFEVGPQ